MVTRTVKNEDRDITLKVVGNIKEENEASIGDDDGTSQSVVEKTGVASVSNVKVPNPVLLAPYRHLSKWNSQIVSLFCG